MAESVEPHVTLIDHATGETTRLEGRPVQELASALVEQARAVRTEAVGTPPGDAQHE